MATEFKLNNRQCKEMNLQSTQEPEMLIHPGLLQNFLFKIINNFSKFELKELESVQQALRIFGFFFHFLCFIALISNSVLKCQIYI